MHTRVPQDIGDYPFDLIVVGAGINGAGIARDAAMRSLRVLLLDKGDVASGTTQWATRLIHGGLRYLEYYEVSLVRESLKDREILLHIAPHLVRPLGFLVPIYERAKHGPLMIRLGMIGVEFTDVLGGSSYRARAPVTLNVAGPWVDEVLGEIHEGRMIGGTKGSHMIVDPFSGAPKNEALYVEARKDGRPYFIVPWNGRYLIGTTDIRYDGDLDRVVADEEEIDYLIEETNYVIPEANLTRESVLFTYSGIRPLPFQPEGAEGSVTRSHIVYDHAKGRGIGTKRSSIGEDAARVEGLISIVGGKLTTYRNLSRQTVDMVYEKLDREAPESRTSKAPLAGGETGDFETFAAWFKATSDLTDELAERLLKLYGVRAPEVLEMAGDDPSLKMPLGPSATVESGIIGAEVLYAFRRELVQTLADVLLRRTMVGLGPSVGLDVDEAAARVAVKHLGWSEDRAKSEVEAYHNYVERYKPKSMRGEETAIVGRNLGP